MHVRVRCSSLFRSCPAHRLIPPLARHTFHRLCLAALGAVAAAAGSRGGSRGGAPSGCCTHRPLCRHPHRAAAAPRRAAAACHRPAAEALSRDRLHLLWLPCCLRGRTPVLALSYPVCVRDLWVAPQVIIRKISLLIGKKSKAGKMKLRL